MRAPDQVAMWNALLTMQRHSWEQGLASHAALDAHKPAFARGLALEAIARQDSFGMLAATGDIGLVNGAACGEAVKALADGGDERAQAALERQRWWILRDSPRGSSGVLHHLNDREEAWVDSIYMVVPFLVTTGDYAPADMQYRMHRDLLFDEELGLFRCRRNVETREWSRDWLWASGNGWAAAGLARALHLGGEAIPTEMRIRWQKDVANLLGRCAERANAQHRFHNVLDEPSTFTDGTAGLLLAYAAYVGIEGGWLDAAVAEVADAWVEGALAHMDSDGTIQHVCGAPTFDEVGTSSEAQSAALMALAARARLPLA